MATLAVSKSNFFETWYPAWFASIPKKKREGQNISGDWSRVTLFKRDHLGKVITNDSKKPKKFYYHLENSTGTLYGVQQKKKNDKPYHIAVKALLIFLNTPFYTELMMGAHLMHLGRDITSFFWRVIPQGIKNIYRKGLIAALGHTFLTILWEIPRAITTDIWRIVRDPIYAFGMMAASFFCIFFPLEGRVWLDRIEREWHEGASYRLDVGYGKSEEELKKMGCARLFSQLMSGKVFFLGYCMQRRGNIEEKIAENPRFEFSKNKTTKW